MNMPATTSTPLSSILLVLAASCIGSVGAVFLKMGAKHLSRGIWGALNWELAAGVALFLGSSVPFIMALKHGELSVLYPMVSLSYVWTMVWSRMFFQEPVTRAKVGALVVILVGITFIGVGGR
jgi:drug/metabolite transporter (DMT)-like permease